MNILTICNISDKVVCNFLTKGARDPIWSEYWISSLCSDGLIKFHSNIQNEHPHNMQYFR